jgi:hypothetical protein
MRSIAVLAALLLAGCGTQQPQNAEEFRQAIPGAFMGKVETVEVNRPFREVATTWQKKAPECLDVTVRTTSSSSTSYQVIVAAYKPTVVLGKERAELHLQVDYKQGVMTVGKVPEGGMYRLVADAYPLPGNRTRVQWFGPSRGMDVVVRAIKSWASGENLGCPDFTKQ